MRQLRHLHTAKVARLPSTRPSVRLSPPTTTLVSSSTSRCSTAQNVLRSANKIDQNMDDPIEIIGEGQAFWRILAPWMTAHSVDAAKIFDRMFSTTYHPQAANNYNYCIAKKYIDSFLTSVMGTANAAATALGSLNEVPSGVTCPTDGNGLITTSSGVFTMIVTDAGTYTLKSVDNDMGASLQFSEAVKKVVDVLVAGTDTDIQVFASRYVRVHQPQGYRRRG